ncbi:MAG: ribose 5-phosphate isomerase B [Clostridia bacterium]|nr:ribose 5-phosphate isomerase B [Clostridia bacterium]
MKIALACDHGGYLLKNEIISKLKEAGFEVEDFGCYSTESVDYPDYAFPAAEAVAAGKADRCIVICTTGIGVSICANKVKGIRCALCTSEFQAEMTRRHNNANALAMGAKTVSAETAWNIVKTFLETEFEGGRHERRVQKIMDHEG